ncbi:MAG: porin family protein [Saprospiraceae bacterium]|nr:porin family protein [Saprospiraceae bacterium]
MFRFRGFLKIIQKINWLQVAFIGSVVSLPDYDFTSLPGISLQVELRGNSFSTNTSLGIGVYREKYERTIFFNRIIDNLPTFRKDTTTQTTKTFAHFFRINYHLSPNKNFRPYGTVGLKSERTNTALNLSADDPYYVSVDISKNTIFAGAGIDYYFRPHHQIRAEMIYNNSIEFAIGYGYVIW